MKLASGETLVPYTLKRACAIFSAAASSGASTWSSYCLRTARAAASTERASSIIGSCEASTAAAPPSHSCLRTAGSPSLLPSTARAASVSGESFTSSWRTMAASGPSHSRMRSSE